MQVRTSELADRELIVDGANPRVQVLTLGAGSVITDTFVCLEGPMVVETRAPRND